MKSYKRIGIILYISTADKHRCTTTTAFLFVRLATVTAMTQPLSYTHSEHALIKDETEI